MRVCFTGHRKIQSENIAEAIRAIDELISELSAQGSVDFYAGGAIGFDTIAALCVLSAQEDGKDVRLHLILPCKDQTRGWSAEHLEKYNFIMSAASSVEYVSEEYVRGCMHKRNRALVDAADICVAYYNGEASGGTAYTVRYAKSQGVEVRNVYF